MRTTNYSEKKSYNARRNSMMDERKKSKMSNVSRNQSPDKQEFVQTAGADQMPRIILK